MDFSCDQFSLEGGEQYASVIVVETKTDKNGYVIRNRYTPEHVTISNRESQVC